MTVSPPHSPSNDPHNDRRARLFAKQPRLLRLGAAIALLMTLIAAACGGAADLAGSSSSDSATADDGDFAYDVEAPQAVEESADFDIPQVEGEPAGGLDAGRLQNSAGEAITTGSTGGQPTAQLPDLGRDIIFTATIELASTDVSRATREAIRSIEGRGGFLFSQETRGGVGGTSVLTFKVLPDQFQAALNDLGTVGTVRSQSISAEDVSAIVVDLESRINTSEASVVRLRKLLDEATKLETIATLENQLLQRETTLEQLRGQLRTVRNQVDLATITVYVSELLNRPSLAIEVMSFAGHDGGFSCFDGPTSRAGEAGDPMTLCYRLTNTGDTPLVDVTLDDPTLGATLGSLVVVDGDVANFEPGDTVVLAHEFELDESMRVRTAVTATGLDTDGNVIDDEVKATAATVRFDVTNVDDGFPGFGEVLSNSWNALATAAVVIALIAVGIAPFLLVALVLGGAALWFARRVRPIRDQRPPRPTPPGPSTQADDTTPNEETTVNA